VIVHIRGEEGRKSIAVRDYIEHRYCLFQEAGLTLCYTCPSHAHVIIWVEHEDGTIIPGDEAIGAGWKKKIVGIVESLVWQTTESMIEELPDEGPAGFERNVG
jgi:hypothetical protein